MRPLFFMFMILGPAMTRAQYIRGHIGSHEQLCDKIYVLNMNSPGSLNSGSEFNLIDSVPIVGESFELRNRPWMKDFDGLIRLQVVPRGKPPYYFSSRLDNQNYFWLNARTTVVFSIPEALRFSEIRFAKIDADNQAVQAFTREKFSWLQANRAYRSKAAGQGSSDSLLKNGFQRLLHLLASDRRDLCRYLAAQELIGFKAMMPPESFSAALPADLSVCFSSSFRKTRHYRRLAAYYESELRKVPFSVFRNLVLQDSTRKNSTLKMPESKILVVDLWASWCKPCRHGNKTYLAAIGARFRPEDVAVVSISLDERADEWLKAMHQDGIRWPSYLDTTGTAGKLALATGVVGLPRLLVFDQYRENVANDLAGDLLLEFLRKLVPEH